jgi:hypothetical protein
MDYFPSVSDPELVTQSIQFLNAVLQKRAFDNCLLKIICGESRIRTCEGETNRFTVCPRWPLEYLPNFQYFKFQKLNFTLKLRLLKSRWRDSNPRPADYKSAALAS